MAPAKREKVEAQLLARVSYGQVSREHEIGESALRRHVSNHLQAALLQSFRENGLAPGDLLDKIVEAMTDASVIRGVALVSGNGQLALRAAGPTIDAAKTLLAAVGSDPATLAADLKQRDLLGKLVATAVGTDAHCAEVLIGLLRRWGHDDDADDLASIAAPAPVSSTTSNL